MNSIADLDENRPEDHGRLLSADCDYISREVFSSQAIYQREQKQIFERNWLYLAHESQVKNPGDFVSAYMGEIPVIVARGADQKIAVSINSCPHRGLRVCRGDQMFYMDSFFNRFPGGLEIIGPPHKWRLKCNWKLPVENMMGDIGHAAFLHGSLVPPDSAKEVEDYSVTAVARAGHSAAIRLNIEGFLSVDRGLERSEGGRGSPLRHDGYLQTLVRAIRPFKANAWAESPPPRTRRFISNVEVEAVDDDEYRVNSNFQLFYSHNGADNHTYTGGRRDVLKEIDGQFKLFRREIIIDWDVITGPTLALIF